MDEVITFEQSKQLTSKQASELFPIPRKYRHLGLSFDPEPIFLEWPKIKTSEDGELNKGRLEGHSSFQKESLKRSFANGIQTWQELPIALEINDPDQKRFTHQQAIGFGRTNAIRSLNQNGHWFWIARGTKSQILNAQSYENTDDLLDVKFQKGEKGVVERVKQAIQDGEVINTMDAIENFIDRVWPNLPATSKGRVKSAVETKSTIAKRWASAYSEADTENFLSSASTEYKFVTKGKLDEERDLYGFKTANIMDAYFNASKKYWQTGKKSYVVLSVQNPTSSDDLKKKRENLLKSLYDIHTMFSELGIKTCPLLILGFLPQNRDDEAKHHLIDHNGKTMAKNKYYTYESIRSLLYYYGYIVPEQM